LAVAATWDTDALYKYGSTMASEFSAKGAQIQLAPGLDLSRIP
jgi:beta-glucosidase-like glycosyl hydrolase